MTILGSFHSEGLEACLDGVKLDQALFCWTSIPVNGVLPNSPAKKESYMFVIKERVRLGLWYYETLTKCLLGFGWDELRTDSNYKIFGTILSPYFFSREEESGERNMVTSLDRALNSSAFQAG